MTWIQYIHDRMTRWAKGAGLLLLILSITSLSAQDVESMMTKANEAYQADDFSSAISQYESILEAGYASTNLYYNLGNAWFKAGKIGPSILNYERALELDPGFEDAQANLELAQTRAVDRIVGVPDFLVFRLWRGFRDALNASQWAWVAVILFWMALGGGTLFLFGKRAALKRAGFISGSLLLLFAIGTSLLASSRYALEKESPYAIVMEQTLYVKSAPGEESSDLFILHEGSKVKLVDKLGDWVEIRLADGKKGWILPASVEPI